jgi:transcriptional regulator with AAA-type ATPase domain/tetratricopeptide (TPR) repeat protein
VDPLTQILGESPAIAAVRDKVRRLLQRPSESRRLPPIFIQGETGTGKGLLARTLHAASPRAGAPFVDVNCAAIPETLLESEMFGFERGAFTDARQAKAGLFQAAHHGTIFLDEVGLLPEPLQAKLLKVIEDHAVRRLGSTKSEPIDVWIVAATSEDLATAMRTRRFREDLYHRLAVVNVALPSLRERGADIVHLAQHFLARACADYGLAGKSLAPEAEAALLGYPWPGNLRELANVMERVALLSEALRVTREMLGLPAAPPPVERASSPRAARAAPPAAGGAERDQLLSALQATGWNISRAAARLGISRNTIRYRLEKHRIQAPGPGDRPSAASRPSRPPAPKLAAGSGDPPRLAPLAPPEPAPSPVASPVPPPAAGPVLGPVPGPVPGPVVVRWERRHVTLLRAVVGGTTPETSVADQSRALAVLVEKVQSFGGRLEALSQSGIQAEFGLEASAVTEDAPGRAAHAAMAMQKAAERGRQGLPEWPAVRIALHTGAFLVGRVGESAEIEREAKREAWGILEALAGRAEPNTIAVSEGAARFLERRFELERLPGSNGGAAPAYRLAGRERAGFGLGGRIIRLVGRHQELALLEGRWVAAARGLGHAVGIVGDAGVGKSRLVHEFRHILGRQGVLLLRSRCAAHTQTTALVPLLDIVKVLGRIREDDPPETARAKLAHTLDGVGLSASHQAALQEVLGLVSGPGDSTLEPEARRRRTFEALGALGLAGTVGRPIVIVIEDLHWVDRSTEEFLSGLLPRIERSPVLFVFTHRPEYEPPWTRGPFYTRIPIRELTDSEAGELLGALLPTEVPEATRRTILDRARGNAFFLEEHARAAVERGGLAPTDPVPDTIQGVIMDRIDRLPDTAKRLLQAASVMGREVSPRVLEAAWRGLRSGGGDLSLHLATLVLSDFLYERTGVDEPLYVFKHGLTQEVAYASLPAADRRALHGAAARALETLHGDRLPEVYDRLAYHYAQTDQADKAVLYLTRFAKQAARISAHAEAIAALRQAVQHIERLPAAPERDRRLVDLVLRQARSLLFLGHSAEIVTLLRAQEARLDSLQDPSVAGPFHFLLARGLSLVADQASAVAYAERAIAEARQCGDEATLGKAYYVLAREAYWAGRPTDAIEHARAAAALLDRSGERVWLAQAEWFLGLGQAFRGEFEAALQNLARVEARGRELEDANLLSYAAVTIGDIRAMLGEGPAGIAECRRGVERSPDPLNRTVALAYLGHAYLEAGDAASAISPLDEARRRLGEFGIRQMEATFTTWLAEACLLKGDVARARELAEDALAVARAGGYRAALGFAERVLGRVLQAEGRLPEARRQLAEALRSFEESEARFEVGRTHLALAEVAGALGDSEAAGRHLAAAASAFQTLGVSAYARRATDLARRLDLPLPPGAVA